MAQEHSDTLEVCRSSSPNGTLYSLKSQERLKSHAESFNGLLSLIPAKYYYGEDTSVCHVLVLLALSHSAANPMSYFQDQWQRKKQTKDQARAAKLAKLDPDNAKSAKDVLDEQAASDRKRKREEDEDGLEVEGIEPETPIMASTKKGKQSKKQKREENGASISPSQSKSKASGVNSNSQFDPETEKKAKAEKRREKKERKKAKDEAKAAKIRAKKERKAQEAALVEDSKDAAGVRDASGEEEEAEEHEGHVADIEMEDLVDDSKNDASSTATPSTARSPAFDTSATHSGSSSISSITAPTADDLRPQKLNVSNAPKETSQIPKPNPEELKARLTQRIEALRRSRHADGLNGAPARTRQELIESRRQKEEARRAHKKALRLKAKEAERLAQAETIARGSPLLSNSPLLSPGSPLTPSSSDLTTSFSFNRIAFPSSTANTNAHATPTLTTILTPKTKPKGPSDPHTALLSAQKRESHLSSLSESQRADISEKETWLNARKRAHGERIRDDTSLLKKTLKRKEKAKKKSEKEWGERIEGVKKGQEIRQKKREGNLKKRREEKGKGGGGKGKGKKAGGKKRPGFEGSFRAKAPAAAAAAAGAKRK